MSKNNINEKKLKMAQKIMLETLIEIDSICRSNNIKYWLDSGTLLGAVRHGGFIPWDDDLDIVMLLDDYNTFCRVAKKKLPKHMFLQTYITDRHFPYDMIKIRNDRGKIIEKHEYGKNVNYNQGIFIDIIPVIMVNASSKFLRKIMFFFIKIFSYKGLAVRKIRHFLIYLHDKRHNRNSNKIIIRSAKFPSHLLSINSNEVFPLKKIEFEKYFFPVPRNYDKYLKMLYGSDYMKLPPKNQRHTHAFKIEIYNDK